MKMSDETKQKMARQRKKRKKEFFNNFDVGSEICLIDESCVCPICGYILGRYEHRGGYYYVLGNSQGDIFIGKVIYSGGVDVIKVPEHTKKYKENKETFDGWINEVKEKHKRELLRYYHSFGELYKGIIIQHTILFNNNGRVMDAKLCLAKEHNGDYYFVVNHSKKNYLITKLVWERGTIAPTVITDEEYEANKEVFESWIQEANKKDKKEENE